MQEPLSPGCWRSEVRGDPTSGFPSSTILSRVGEEKRSLQLPTLTPLRLWLDARPFGPRQEWSISTYYNYFCFPYMVRLPGYQRGRLVRQDQERNGKVRLFG